jgi:serine/threonine protein kinase
LKIGQLLNGKYKVIKRIHEGGQASLFLALIENDSIDFKKSVAIKYFDKDERPFEEFKDEVTRLSELDHPNIANILDVGIENERPFFVLDYIDGLNLKELSEKLQLKKLKLSPAEIFEILEKVLEALIYAHNFKSKEILHRDISLTNIMISKEGNIKLLDFGISGIAVEKLAGKISYLPNSLIEKKLPFNSRIDLYSLGVVAYELLCQKKIKSERDIVLDVIKDKNLKSILKKLLDFKSSNSIEILKELKKARVENESNLCGVMSKVCDDQFIVESTQFDLSSDFPKGIEKRKKYLRSSLVTFSLFAMASFSVLHLDKSLKTDIKINVKTPTKNVILRSKSFDLSPAFFTTDLEDYSLNACESYCYQNLFGASVGQIDFFNNLKKRTGVKNKLESFDTYFPIVLDIFDESKKSFEKEKNKCQNARACSALIDLYRYIDLQVPTYKNDLEYQDHMKRVIGGGDSEFAKLAKKYTDFELKRIGHDYNIKFIPNGLGSSINKIQVTENLDKVNCRDIGDEAYLVQSRYKSYEFKSFNLFDFEVVIFNKKTRKGPSSNLIEIGDEDLKHIQACHYKRSHGKIVALEMLEIQE